MSPPAVSATRAASDVPISFSWRAVSSARLTSSRISRSRVHARFEVRVDQLLDVARERREVNGLFALAGCPP